MNTATRFARTLRVGVLLLAGTLFALPNAHAQITLDADDARALYAGSRETTSYDAVTNTGFQAIVDATGPNQTFDFTAATYEETSGGTVSFLQLPADVPGANLSAFSGATSVIAVNFSGDAGNPDSTSWLYQDIRDDGIYMYGIYFLSDEDIDGDGNTPDELAITYTPPLRSQAFPLTYGTTWSGSTTQAFNFGGQSFGTDVSVTSEVDAYGTLVTPAGSAPALRLKSTEERTTFGQTTTSVDYTFITETGELSASLYEGPLGWTGSYSVTSGGSGTAAEGPNGLPADYELAQNYPNPFNPETTIRYALPQSGPVTLAVFDVLGRRVTTLVDGPQTAGRHDVRFDAAGLPAGQYFYRLRAGSVSETRSMVLLP